MNAEPEVIELLGEAIRIAINMAQELQDIVDEAEAAGCTNPFPSTQALLNEWNAFYKTAQDME